MTTERDFDRIARAWLEFGPNEAPDRSIEAALDAIDTIPQARQPWRWPLWRPTTMTRITLLAVLAGLFAIVVGGLMLSGGTTNPSPIPTASPSIAASASPGPIPAAVKGGWVGHSRGTAYEDPAVTTLVLGGSSMDSSAPDFSIDRPQLPRTLGSSMDEVSPGVLRFTMSTMAGPGCVGKDVGTYRWSTSADGQWLTLALIADACDVRGQILPGTWQRNLAFSNKGGPGLAVNFQPYVSFTLPAETWKGTEFADIDTTVLDNSGGTADLRFWKDPDGFVDPCDRAAGRLDLAPGIDGVVTYLRQSPQFTVLNETELTVDGRRAVEVEIRLGDNIKQPCAPMDGNEANRTGILLWAPHAADGASWNGTFGDHWSVVVTEADGATILMEIARQDGTSWPIDRSVLDSIRFTNELPTPPAS